MTTEPHDHEHMHEYDPQHHHPHRDDQDDTMTYYRVMESAVRDLLIEKKIINADQIIVLDDGKIIESGNHDELLSNNGIYKKLYEREF